jgi:hypothetical protein
MSACFAQKKPGLRSRTIVDDYSRCASWHRIGLLPSIYVRGKVCFSFNLLHWVQHRRGELLPCLAQRRAVRRGRHLRSVRFCTCPALALYWGVEIAEVDDRCCNEGR